MVDSGEPRTPSGQSEKISPIIWPSRPVKEPIIGLNTGLSKPEPRATNEKPEPFSIADAPSAKTSEERKDELRKMGAGIAAKNPNLLDEGGIVDAAIALSPSERGFLYVSYASALTEGSARDKAGTVANQENRKHIISQIAELVEVRQEADKKNSPAA